MRLRAALSTGQRVILVVGSGLGLYLLGGYVTTLGSGSGWVGYAPLTSAQLADLGGFHRWVKLLIWLALLMIWIGAALFLFKPKSTTAND